MIVTPQEGVERQREHDQQQPERVGRPARAPGRGPPAARRTASPTTTRCRCISSCSERRVQRRVVPAGEVQRPRADHEQQEGQRREGQHHGHPRVQHGEQPPPRPRTAACAASASPAPRARGTAAPPSRAPCAGPCAPRAGSCRRSPSPEDVAKNSAPRPTTTKLTVRIDGPVHRRGRAAPTRRTGTARRPTPSSTVSTGSRVHAVNTRPKVKGGRSAREPALGEHDHQSSVGARSAPPRAPGTGRPGSV